MQNNIFLVANSDGEVYQLDTTGMTSTIGAIGGSGTLNYIPKFTPDGNTLGDSLLYDDGTGVGIGTTSPSNLDRLFIVGSGTNRVSIKVQNTNSNGNSSFYFENNRGGFSTYGGLLTGGSTDTNSTLFGLSRIDRTFLISDGATSEGLAIGTLTSDSLYFGTNNIERMRIDSSGNVGIGVTAPTSKLHVLGSVNLDATTNDVLINSSNLIRLGDINIISNAAQVKIDPPNSTVDIGDVEGDTSAYGLKIDTDNEFVELGQIYSDPFSPKARIDISGFRVQRQDETTTLFKADVFNFEVGIGTATPSGIFDVQGTTEDIILSTQSGLISIGDTTGTIVAVQVETDLGEIALVTQDTFGNILLSSTQSSINLGAGVNGFQINLTATAVLARIVDDRATPTGLVYAADYSSTITDRSLVDKEYVDNTSKEAVTLSVNFVNSNTTIPNTYTKKIVYIVEATGSTVEITLPNASLVSDLEVVIKSKHTSTSDVDLLTQSSQEIDGNSSITLSSENSATLIPYDGDWYII